MWSGRYTHHCESWNNFKGLESDMWALPDGISSTYKSGFFGKRDYRSGGHTILARLSAWLGPVNENRPVFDEDPAQEITLEDSTDPRCHHKDWEHVDQICEFFKASKDDQKPFFLAYSSGLVHASFKTNRYWYDQIPADLVDIPPEDPAIHPAIQYQRMAKAWRHGFDEKVVRQVRRIYFAMCAETDFLLGRVLDAVNSLGLQDETTIIFTSDHGELALEHQDYYKMSLYEGSVRVPMIISGPGLAKKLKLPNLVSLIDLCPTLLELMDQPRRWDLDGESLLPLLQGETTESRNTAYAMFSGCTLNTTGFMFRKGPWKLIAYTGYHPQVFNLDDDPMELLDRAATEPEIVADLTEQLQQMVDMETTHADWIAYNKQAFREFQRQAKRGLYVDNAYGLKGCPSSDYMTIMDNAFTGWDASDEDRAAAWLAE